MLTFVASRLVSPTDEPVFGLAGIMWSTDFELLRVVDNVLYARQITIDLPIQFDATTGQGFGHSFFISPENLKALLDQYAKVNDTHC